MEAATPPGADQRARGRTRWTWPLLVLILFSAAAVRVRLAATPLERDEGEYAYAGQLLLHGVPPYRSAYNLKFPGVYLAYGAFEAVGGQTATAVHLGIAAAVAASTILVFALGRRMWGSDGPAVAAAAAFAALSLDPNALALAGHAEHLVLPPVLGGLLLVVSLPATRAAFGRTMVAGALLAVGVLMKQPAAAFVALGYAAVAYGSGKAHAQSILPGWRLQPPPVAAEAATPVMRPRTTFSGSVLLGAQSDRRRLAARSAAFAVGVAAPLLAVAAWLAYAGVFGRFWFWTVDYARSYAAQVPLSGAPHVLGNAVARLTQNSWPLWTLGAIGLASSAWDRRRRRAAIGVGAFGAVAFAAVSAGFLYRNHYFILLMPAAALGVAGLFAGRRPAIAAIVLVAAIGWQVAAQSTVLFRLSPEQVNRDTYKGEAFVEAAAVGRYLRVHAPTTATVAVLGSEPEIYFEARRRSATGYVYTYALLEPQPHAMAMQHEMAAEIERARPAYVVWVHLGNSWFQPQDRSPTTWIFDWWSAYSANYELVATAEEARAATLDERPDDAALGRSRTSPGLFVFRRRDGR